jgi:alpha-glucosidase
MIGADLNALVNCDIVHNVAARPDPKYFPNGLKTD